MINEEADRYCYSILSSLLEINSQDIPATSSWRCGCVINLTQLPCGRRSMAGNVRRYENESLDNRSLRTTPVSKVSL